MAGRFPTAWLDEFYARVDIVSIVSSYVSLKKDGRRYWGLCPFHNEKTPSFSVNADLNLYYCFGCKAGGNAVNFVMEMERLPYYDAVKQLAEKMHMTLPEMQEDPDYERRKNQRDRLLSANREAARYYHDKLWTPDGQKVLDYLHGRGLSDGIIRRFGLGASSDQWDDLTGYLTDKGYTPEELALCGLSVVKGDHTFDMFRSRAMFPIIDVNGDVLGFGGRAMGDAKPKYLNTADTPVFNKRKGAYAVNLLRKKRDLKRVLLMEGYMDVVAAAQFKVEGAVATLGTSLTNEQARLLKRFAPEVWVAYDGDEAGQHAIERALGIFEAEGVPAKVLCIPDGLDPDEYLRQCGVEAFQRLRPIDGVTFQMQRLRNQFDLETQDGRTEYAKACAKLLKKVNEPVEMENHLEYLSVQTGFSKDVLSAQIGVAVEKPDANRIGAFRENFPQKRSQIKEGYRTEQTLLALMVTGKLPENMLQESDFSDEGLLNLYRAIVRGEKPSDIMANAGNDAERQTAGEVFSLLSDVEKENASGIAEDCLRNLRIQHTQRAIQSMTEMLRSIENEEKRSEALREIAALSKELARLKQQGR